MDFLDGKIDDDHVLRSMLKSVDNQYNSKLQVVVVVVIDEISIDVQ